MNNTNPSERLRALRAPAVNPLHLHSADSVEEFESSWWHLKNSTKTLRKKTQNNSPHPHPPTNSKKGNFWFCIVFWPNNDPFHKSHSSHATSLPCPPRKPLHCWPEQWKSLTRDAIGNIYIFFNGLFSMLKKIWKIPPKPTNWKLGTGGSMKKIDIKAWNPNSDQHSMAKQQQGSSIGRYSVIQGRHWYIDPPWSTSTVWKTSIWRLRWKMSTPNKESLWQLPFQIQTKS